MPQVPSFEASVLTLCRDISYRFGIVMESPSALTPLEIAHACGRDEFARGVLSCAAQFVDLLSQTPNGRQALFDFFLQPIREDVEGPRSGGGND